MNGVSIILRGALKIPKIFWYIKLRDGANTHAMNLFFLLVKYSLLKVFKKRLIFYFILFNINTLSL